MTKRRSAQRALTPTKGKETSSKGVDTAPKINEKDIGKMLIYAMVAVGIVIVGLLVYQYSRPVEEKVFSNLTPHIELTPGPNITLEPFEEPAVWGFADVYHAIRHLDKKYETVGADFHQESLRKQAMVRANSVDDYVRDLDILTYRIGNNTIDNQTKSIKFFLQARREMLLSEKYFQEALSYGLHGIFNRNLNCEDRDIIETSNKLYNLSNQNGWHAMNDLDKALTAWENARYYIGINSGTQKNRPAFYDNIFIDIGYLVNTNVDAIGHYCDGYSVRENVTVKDIATGNLTDTAYIGVPQKEPNTVA